MEPNLEEELSGLQKLCIESPELINHIGHHLAPQEVDQLRQVCHFFANLFSSKACVWSHFTNQLGISLYRPHQEISLKNEVKGHLLRVAAFAENDEKRVQYLIQKYQLNREYKPFLRVNFARGMSLITIFPPCAHGYLAGYGEPHGVVPLPRNYKFGDKDKDGKAVHEDLMQDPDPRVRDGEEYTKYSGLLNGLYGYKRNPGKAQKYFEKCILNGNQNLINLKIMRAGVDSVIGMVNNPIAVKEVIKSLDGEKNYLVGFIYKALGLKYGILGFSHKPDKAARFIKKKSLSY